MCLCVNVCMLVPTCVCLSRCQIHCFQVKELRNQGDEVAREVMMRAVEGAGSQRKDFEELMRLVRAAPFQIMLHVGRSEVDVGGNRVP